MANLRLFIAIQIPGPIKIKMAEAQQKITRNNPHVRSLSSLSWRFWSWFTSVLSRCFSRLISIATSVSLQISRLMK